MGSIQFYINKNKGTEDARQIMLSYNFNGQRLFYYTRKRISEDHFIVDKKTKKLIKITGNDRIEINARLKLIKDLIGELERKAIAAGEPLTPDQIREKLDQHIKAKAKDQEPEKITLKKYFQFFVDELTNRVNIRTGRKLSGTMPQKYKNLQSIFNHFCEEQGKEYDFEDIDSTFYNQFVAYLVNNRKYSVNTYGRAIKFFKTVLYDAASRNVNKNFSFIKALQGVTEQADSIYLTESELTKIFEHDFSDMPHLDRVRDMFLIGCWTGLRYSDFSQIKPEDVKNNRIRVLTQKTKQKVTIPVNPVVKSILEKYNYELPPAITNQRFNEYIKDVVKAAEINEQCVKRITKAGITETKTKAKFEFVSSHTARRSFATNMFLQGVPAIVIMGITGHATEKEFMKYIKVSEEQKADLFEKYVNWNKKPGRAATHKPGVKK